MSALRKIGWFTFVLWACSGSLGAADLRVMTWDVEDAYPSDKTEVIAGAVKKHKVDILALQNVQISGTRFQQEVQDQLDKLFGKGVYRNAVTASTRFDGNAIFWNTRTVQASDENEDDSLKMTSKRLRPAQVMHVRAGSLDFRVVNVNLYEGVDQDDDAKIRQATLLRNLLKKIGGRDESKALILVGNLQMGFPDEKIFDELTDDFDVNTNPAFRELNSDNFLKFCTRELARKNPHAFSYIGDLLESSRLIDHVAANDAAWKYYVKGSAEVVRIDKEFFDSLDDYEWNFSDHLPVIAKFRTK